MPRRDRTDLTDLSRLERQIMDALYARGEAGVSEITAALGGDSSYDSVRVTLARLEREGRVTHSTEGQRYIYRPSVPGDAASRSAMRHVLRTFFQGSPSEAILTLIDMSKSDLSPEEVEEIRAMIDEEAEK